jgi:hypothetical protein
MALESRFQADLIKELREMFPGCVILKNDPNYLQGFPDLLILYRAKWAALEVKKSRTAPHRPNQPYYVSLAAEMSFGAFIFPENKEEVLNALQQTFRSRRDARVPVRQ